MSFLDEKKILYRIKHDEATYPWPCNSDPDRTITVTKHDLFSITIDGTVVKHTGVGCFGILIPKDDFIEIYE